MPIDALTINNVYAAYAATSAGIDKKDVSELSRMVKGNETKESAKERAAAAEANMDKVIISKEALALMKERAQAI